MPGMSGLDLVRRLNTIVPGIQVVVLTGYGSIATAVEAVRHGAVNYLTKPADAEQILAAFDREGEGAAADASAAAGGTDNPPSLCAWNGSTFNASCTIARAISPSPPVGWGFIVDRCNESSQNFRRTFSGRQWFATVRRASVNQSFVEPG